MAQPRVTPTDEQRVREFFRFCDELEKHPFFVAHAKGGKLSLAASCPEEGEDVVVVNFDEVHLESMLARLRQFLSEREMFFYKDVRRAICAVFAERKEFQSFYHKMVAALGRPFPERSFQVFKANGQEICEGFTFTQLIEARLYTGPLHSERIVNAEPGSAEEGLRDSHDVAKKQMALDLARASLVCIQNIMALRNWTHRLAQLSGRVGRIPEVQAFDERVKRANT